MGTWILLIMPTILVIPMMVIKSLIDFICSLDIYETEILSSKGKLIPDPTNTGRLVLDGEGPYRLVIPQKIAGGPDRPSTATPVGDGWDYDSNKDHNWGFFGSKRFCHPRGATPCRND